MKSEELNIVNDFFLHDPYRMSEGWHPGCSHVHIMISSTQTHPACIHKVTFHEHNYIYCDIRTQGIHMIIVVTVSTSMEYHFLATGLVGLVLSLCTHIHTKIYYHLYALHNLQKPPALMPTEVSYVSIIHYILSYSQKEIINLKDPPKIISNETKHQQFI